jgi:nicotinamide mononucleotide transporter
MDILKNERVQLFIGIVISLIVLGLPYQTVVEFETLSLLEVVSFIAYGWSTWLLSKNRALGWWIGLIGVVGYMIVFYRVQLYGETGIQTFYLITSLQAIYIWLRGGQNKTEKPVEHVPTRWLYATIPLAIIATLGLQYLLIQARGAFPFVDALTTIMSLVAHLYLMQRYVESWYIWIAVDVIYMPLYASRGLFLTSILYAGLLLMSIQGLLTFRHIIQKRKQAQAGFISA